MHRPPTKTITSHIWFVGLFVFHRSKEKPFLLTISAGVVVVFVVVVVGCLFIFCCLCGCFVFLFCWGRREVGIFKLSMTTVAWHILEMSSMCSRNVQRCTFEPFTLKLL